MGADKPVNSLDTFVFTAVNSTRWARIIFVITLLISATSYPTDFAQIAQRDAWLVHPIYGEASFDTFTRIPGNPVVRGKAPRDWPVNGFLFEDPVSRNWYAYIGHYGRNYTADVPMVCTVSRSTDQGASWEDLGPIFPDTPHTFDGENSPEGHAPDVSVLYADGKYHLVYDWLTQSSGWGDVFNPDATQNSGVGYAWADKPEGPFHRTTKPVSTTRDQSALLGKYRRQYASTLIRRANDWLVLTLTDSGPNFGWAYLGRSAERPEGPWSEAVLLLHPEGDSFHPPLLEFHPSFAQDGYLYAPATSVALNRNVQAIFRAPLEEAMNPNAWQLFQYGSIWHAEPVENEYDGIWGQAFSGFVGQDGFFNVLFPSRDPGGFGTINLARRLWRQPWNDQGFVVSSHRGPSLALLKRSGTPRQLQARLSVCGTVRLIWDANMPLGPDEPRSDATLHPLMKTRYQGIELEEKHWRLVNVDEAGAMRVNGEGDFDHTGEIDLDLTWTGAHQAAFRLGNRLTWEGTLTAGDGAFGFFLEPRSHARVSRFAVEGEFKPAARRYLWSEGVLSAAQQVKDWNVVQNDARFTCGAGAISIAHPASAKWNVEGSQIIVYAPRSPEFKQATLYIDGKQAAKLDYAADRETSSTILFESNGLARGRHTVRIEADEGPVPLDLLEVRGD